MEVKVWKHCTHCHNELRLILKFKSLNTLLMEFETAKTEYH